MWTGYTQPATGPISVPYGEKEPYQLTVTVISQNIYGHTLTWSMTNACYIIVTIQSFHPIILD